jgi:RecG-like helicase
VPLSLSTPVKYIKRVGERIAAGLSERGVSTVEDLLYHLPFRYEDRLHPRPLSLYQPGDMASLVGEVRGTALLRTRSGPIFEMTVGITPPTTPPDAPFVTASSSRVGSHDADPLTDPCMAGLLAPPPSFAPPQSRYPEPGSLGLQPEVCSGLIASYKKKPALAPGAPSPILETVKCMWFHGAYLKDKFHPGQSIALYGKLEGSRSGNALHAPPGSTRFKMIQPTFEILPDAHATGDDAEFTMLEMGRIVPVYESLGGKTPWGAKLTSRWHRRIMWTIFRDLSESTESTQTPSSRPERSAVERPLYSAETGTQPPGLHDLNTPTRSLPPSAQDDTLPTALRQRLSFPTRMDALRDLHFPPAGTSMTELMSARTPAHRRLIFEEFFYLELGLELKRRRLRERQGTAFVTNDQVREALKQILPFKPTAAQKRVLGEIVHDMRRTQPMRRLLQGDVGSGKTIVAFQAALVAIENGYQVALMAPTEILATQHYLSARKLLSEKISPRTQRPYRIGLLTGSLDDRTKRDTRSRIFRGEIDLAIGTHALVEEKVDFANLGLVIVDEQHRFGVQQRFQLMRKPNSGTASTTPLATTTRSPSPSAQDSGGPSSTATASGGPSSTRAFARQGGVPSSEPNTGAATTTPLTNTTRSPSPSAQDEPDVLVMTATPIPRTLALTLYGDLEASVIDELPPGRTPIQTRRMPEERSAEVWDFVRKQVAAGRQAYIVYPIIEGPSDDQPELDFAKFDEADDSSSPPTTPSSRPERTTQTSSSRPESALFADAVERPLYSSTAATKFRGKTAPLRATKAKRSVTRPKLRSATEMHEELSLGPLKGLRLGLLHGRMSADDKEVTMARFKRGEIDVLVSTTVIEVGVDVANSTVMVIEHADRFGLAQLHQLRGRVGRGAARSFCVLLTGATITPEAELRLDAMIQTQDGFALAELDLQQRGPGEFFGTRQAGLPDLRVANLARDRDLLELARHEAARFAASPDPTIPRSEIDAVWSRLKLQWQRRYALVEA